MLPTRPILAVRKYIAIAVITVGTMIGASISDRTNFLARISPRTRA
jgi:hypothetical protein